MTLYTIIPYLNNEQDIIEHSIRSFKTLEEAQAHAAKADYIYFNIFENKIF